jgi:hypothetical protein
MNIYLTSTRNSYTDDILVIYLIKQINNNTFATERSELNRTEETKFARAGVLVDYPMPLVCSSSWWENA